MGAKRIAFALLSACVVVAVGASSCGSEGEETPPPTDEARYRLMRDRMVDRQIEARGVEDARVLAALRKVPRHEFVPPDVVHRAYDDGALPIGKGQTISQPYIVGLMTELLKPEPTDRVLEIGTGSGYQAAVLSELVAQVYSIEIVDALADSATARLVRLGYENVSTRCGDGYKGWPAEAPFDGIIVTAAPDHVPEPLVEQLKEGGHLVIPVGSYSQELMLLRKTSEKVEEKRVIPVRFVPMTGEAQK